MTITAKSRTHDQTSLVRDAISRTIVEAHGGHISACQDAERGATFRFTLPADREVPSLGA